ncbi:ribosome-associated protein [Seinonella peptonophila]|uniref:Ribosome-associated protein n=1 Tax=Seinonella peptonophila TaxID=112248 RepID=A0A1M4WZG5_9BACL|nr:RNA-binding S4 domain-containing protein [Seinonella peptonophila]SHE86604.1 ribosome-associated protein [Seinonella peptonophila]
MQRVVIQTSYITLGQFLKKIGVAQTGGEVKHLLSDQQVKVDRIVEDRRGRKLYPGANVEIRNTGSWIIVTEEE